MALTKVTDATIEPVTLAEARSHLRILDPLDTSNDADIARLITVARTDAEDRMRRTIIDTTWRLMLDHFPSAIRLPMPRIIGVSELKYIDADGNLQTLDSSMYSVDVASEPGWIVPAWDQSWPTARDQMHAVSVLYSAGYGTNADNVPSPIKQWVLHAVEEMHEHRGLTSAQPMVPHDFMHHLLDNYTVTVMLI